MRDEIIRAITTDGYVKASVITGRDLVERARNIHTLLPVATAALTAHTCQPREEGAASCRSFHHEKKASPAPSWEKTVKNTSGQFVIMRVPRRIFKQDVTKGTYAVGRGPDKNDFCASRQAIERRLHEIGRIFRQKSRRAVVTVKAAGRPFMEHPSRRAALLYCHAEPYACAGCFKVIVLSLVDFSFSLSFCRMCCDRKEGVHGTSDAVFFVLETQRKSDGNFIHERRFA